MMKTTIPLNVIHLTVFTLLLIKNAAMSVGIGNQNTVQILMKVVVILHIILMGNPVEK